MVKFTCETISFWTFACYRPLLIFVFTRFKLGRSSVEICCHLSHGDADNAASDSRKWAWGTAEEQALHD